MTAVVFDMETGDPDDLITLIMLLMNPDVELKAITCWGGSPVQIGLIQHVLGLAGKCIPVGGSNVEEPIELSDYYTKVVGAWKPCLAAQSATDVLSQYLDLDTVLLTGAPLTNIAAYLNTGGLIGCMVTQGGYLGNVVPFELRLDKFKKRDEVPTYNLGNDLAAFQQVNYSDNISELVYVTKDLCHGFLYTNRFHNTVKFADTKLGWLLKKCLGYYAGSGRDKAMHDPLAMLFALYPEVGECKSVAMSYRMVNERPLFSSVACASGFTSGMVGYDSAQAWLYFKNICEGA